MYKQLVVSAIENNFFLKPGYQSRLKPEYFKDVTGTFTWQPQVYYLASYLGEYLDCRYIIDLGCGTAKKLVKLHPKFQIVGIDIGYNLNYCKEEYPYGTWLEHDLEKPGPLNISEGVLNNSIIICADVVEHLVNPALLLWKIKMMLDFSPACLISTPERDFTGGPDDIGPPKNNSHVREWNMIEFTNLLNSFQFNLKYTRLTISNDVEKKRETILSVLGNNDPLNDKTKRLDNYEVNTNFEKLS